MEWGEGGGGYSPPRPPMDPPLAMYLMIIFTHSVVSNFFAFINWLLGNSKHTIYSHTCTFMHDLKQHTPKVLVQLYLQNVVYTRIDINHHMTDNVYLGIA